MIARKVYESDIFKPKNIDTILSNFNYVKPEVYEMLRYLIYNNYKFDMGGFKWETENRYSDYEKHQYYFQGKKILWGDLIWFDLKMKKYLDNMDFFFIDSWATERPRVESSILLHAIEDGTYELEVHPNLKGTWNFKKKKNIEYDNDDYYPGTAVITKEEIIPTLEKLLKGAESFLRMHIIDLKKYAMNW